MPTIYPARIDNIQTLPTTTDGSTQISAASLNFLRGAILAIESTLGANPAGIYATVRARLDAIEQILSNVTGGGGGQTIVFSGDIHGSNTSQVVQGIQSVSVNATLPTTGQTLIYDGTKLTYGTNFGSQNITTTGGITGGAGVVSSLAAPLITLTGKQIFNGVSAPSISSGGQAIIYYDQSANKLLVSEDGYAYVDLVGVPELTLVVNGSSPTITQGYAIQEAPSNTIKLGNVSPTVDRFLGVALGTFSAGQRANVQISGMLDPAIVNLGDGYRCAVGIKSTGQLARVTDATCVSAPNYVGWCDEHGIITIAPRIAENFNVLDFGAVGDGITDDTATIQFALNSAGSNYTVDSFTGAVFGGGTVFLPSATFRVTASLNIPHGSINSNIMILGSGQNSTIIRGDGYFNVISSVWGDNSTVSTILHIRDLAISTNFNTSSLHVWVPNTHYNLGAVITSGMSNRLLQCTQAGTTGAHRPFHQLWSGVISDPVITITGVPTGDFQQVVIEISTGGTLGISMFEWSVDSWTSINGPVPTASSVVLGSTGLTANFSAGTYVAARFYTSPPLGFGFSTVHGDTITDGYATWNVIDGGSCILQFNGGECYIERVHCLGAVMGIIFDGTETSTIKDCWFDTINGVWITGGNQRLNNSSIDSDNSSGQSNVVALENCLFDNSQIGIACESNATIKITGVNFEAGQWYGWTTAVLNMSVDHMESEGAQNGWFLGSLAPFNGNASYPNHNILFDECTILPLGGISTGFGPTIQFSNTSPAAGFTYLATPAQSVTFNRCYMGSHAPNIFVGCGGINGLRVVDLLIAGGINPNNIFDSGTTDKETSIEASDNLFGVNHSKGIGCIPQVGLDLNTSLAIRSSLLSLVDGYNNNISIANSTAEIAGPANPFIITGIAGGTPGRIIFLYNMTTQQMTINNQDTNSLAINRIICLGGQNIILPIGNSFVMLQYLGSQSRWVAH